MIFAWKWDNWSAGLVIVCIIGVPMLAHYQSEIRWHLRYAAARRADRRALRTDTVFHIELLEPDERSSFTGRSGLTAEQWVHAAAADFWAERREHIPTGREFYDEFSAAMRAHHRWLRKHSVD